ncbi:MAG: hypothetical protein ACFB5Z_12560 [Elainellaceae cyanobacterium]
MATTPTSDIISNLEYDWLSTLHNKAEAVKAYEQYISDAEAASSQPCVDLFKKIRDAEIEQIREIREHLMAVMQHGKM